MWTLVVMGPRRGTYLVIFVFRICVVDTAVALKVSPDVVDFRVFCCLLVIAICCACIYMFGWFCRATYCSVVPGTWYSYLLWKTHLYKVEKKLLQVVYSLPGMYIYGVYILLRSKRQLLSITDWMIETQLCKLCGTSDTFVGRAYSSIFHL